VNAYNPADIEGDLQPVRLQFFHDTLYVSYNARARIDLYSPELELIATVPLDDPEPVYPTSFVVTDSELIVADHARRLVVTYDRSGTVTGSYGTLPEGRQLTPFAVTAYGGVAYLSDLGLHRILAVSLVDAAEITEKGELILTIPSDTSLSVGFTSALLVTPDGRLLVGDAAVGEIKVFTCDGRYVYDFDSVQTPKLIGPQGFARDDVIDPSLQDSSSFDPSGLPRMGRFHVVDGNNGRIHMFNPVGKYVASYPEDDVLKRPAGIAIDRQRNRVYVADPVAGRINVFAYEE
jgi:sugar lactone lactonase YvrE